MKTSHDATIDHNLRAALMRWGCLSVLMFWAVVAGLSVRDMIPAHGPGIQRIIVAHVHPHQEHGPMQTDMVGEG
jgi:hypothetical protein